MVCEVQLLETLRTVCEVQNERRTNEAQKQRILRLRPMMLSSKMNLPFLSFYLIQEVNETVRKGSPTSQSVERRTLAVSLN